MSKKDDNKDDDRGDGLTEDQLQAIEDMKAKAKDDGVEIKDEDLDAAIAAMRGEDPDDKKNKDDKGGKDGNMVPQSRFDEATAKLNQQIDDLQAQIDAKPEPAAAAAAAPAVSPLDTVKDKLEAARDQYEDALLDGDRAKVKEIRTTITDLEEDVQAMIFDAASNTARTQSTEDIKYDGMLKQLEVDNPTINPDHKDFDKAVMQRMARISNALQQAGTPAASALKEASDLVLGVQTNKVDDALRGRDKKSRAAAAKAAVTQGADLSEIGSSRGSVEPALRVDKLSDAQFEKLPEDVASQLRGDELTPDQMEQ